jgi:hypothetical protein
LHFLSYGDINSTLSVTFFLGFDAISHSYPIITKGHIFYRITIIPLFLCTTHIHHSKHTLFSLKSSVYISNYLNVTAALELGATRGGERQQEVASGGQKWRAAALQQRSRAGAPEEEERGGSEGLVCKNRKIQGPHYKLKFLTDPKP